MALNRKIAYIDLSTGDVQTKPIPLGVRKKFLGGRGLDAYLLFNHTKKGCDPLRPDNALIIIAGILTAFTLGGLFGIAIAVTTMLALAGMVVDALPVTRPPLPDAAVDIVAEIIAKVALNAVTGGT